MGQRKGGSAAAGMGVLLVLGMAFAAFSAAYKIFVENLAAIVVFGALAGLLLMLWFFFSKLESRKSAALDRSVAAKHPQIQLPTERGYVQPRVQFGSRTKSAATSGNARWVLPNEAVTVQGASITGGTFYLGTALYFDGHVVNSYVVNPKLSAKSAKPDVDGASMPYWPSYVDVTPAARRAFLEWMATGRQIKPYGIGHVFLYFYGLEHRVFVDRDVASVPALIAEVVRLLAIYGDNSAPPFRNLTSFAASMLPANAMTATGAPGNTSVMPATLKYAATPARAPAATSAKALLRALVGSLRGATTSGTIDGAAAIGSAGFACFVARASASNSCVCFGAESEPHAGRLELIDSTLNLSRREGFQSAPIGTPLQEQLLKYY